MGYKDMGGDFEVTPKVFCLNFWGHFKSFS